MITSVLDYLEKTAREYPEKTAFQDEKCSYSFYKLAEIAQSIGTSVAKISLGRKPVVVFMEKNAKMIGSFMGIVYAGCFYVPIDKDMPAQRITMIIDQLDPCLIIFDETTEKRLSEFAKDIPTIRYDAAACTEKDETLLSEIRAQGKNTDLLYVLFTSGSTGKPKGVSISHAAIINCVEWLCSKYEIDDRTILCSQCPFYFDVSVPDIFFPLKKGATTYIPPKSYYTFPKKILHYIEEHQVNTLSWVPSALCNVVNSHAFDTCIPKSLRLILFCGEVMPCKQLNVWRSYVPDALYVNMYGPTEATYACMHYEVESQFSDADSLPIGKAFGNTRILLLNEENKQAAIGEIGEICILGQCLSNGYYNAWEKTAEAFMQNPLNPCWEEKMYRTGDLAYADKEGMVFYVGRKDSQIKRLGYRIELGEIESAIRSVPNIENGCCLFLKKTSEILAIFCGKAEEKEIVDALSEKLPRYMLPNRYIRLEQMPMNLNGKIDRAALKKRYAEE